MGELHHEPAAAPLGATQRKVGAEHELVARGAVARGHRQPRIGADLDHLIDPDGAEIASRVACTTASASSSYPPA